MWALQPVIHYKPRLPPDGGLGSGDPSKNPLNSDFGNYSMFSRIRACKDMDR